MAVERERASGVRSSTPKDLSRWLEAIVWLDLEASDIWSPADLKR